MLVTSRTVKVIDLMKNGAADNEIQVVVRLTWNNPTGTAYQNFVFNEGTIQSVMESNTGAFNGFGRMFYVNITGMEDLENLTATVMIVSGSNAADAGKTLTVKTTAAK